MITAPGRAKLASEKTWWQTPAWMSKKCGIPCSATNSRIVLWFWAYFSSAAGTMWSRTMTILPGATTFARPSFLNSPMMADELS